MKYDLVGNIMAFEAGALDEDGIRALFQHLVDTGLAWTLQGSYGRMAMALLDAGEIHWTDSKDRRRCEWYYFPSNKYKGAVRIRDEGKHGFRG